MTDSISREAMPYGKILAIDYMQTGLDIMELLLKPYQLQTETAGKSSDAIEKIKTGAVYDVIFINEIMPEIKGADAVKSIRALGYKNAILAMTADELAGEGPADGFDGYIAIPVDMQRLDSTLKKYVRGKRISSIEKIRDTVPGLDFTTGLALYNGDYEIYLSVMRSFVTNSFSVIEKLRAVSKETLPDYAVSVHGMKGICSGIGAEELRQTAYNLEMMAKSGDLAGIQKINGDFLENASGLTTGIKTAFEKLDNSNPRPRLHCPDPALLEDLRKCFESYDMKGIDEIMDKLESFDYETGASLVSWLREKIREMDFPAAAERLSGNNGGV